MFKKKVQNRQRIFFLFFIFLIFIIVFKTFTIKNSESSILLFEGRQIAKNGIQYTNKAAPASGLHIVVQQWLYAFIFYFVYKTTGWIGLSIMMVFEMALFIWLASMLAKTYGYSKSVSLGGAISIGLIQACLVAQGKLQIITNCLLMTEMITLEKYAMSKKKKYLAYAILTVLAEVNFHAYVWIIHIIIAIPYMIPYKTLASKIFKKNTKRYYSVLPVWIATGFMCLAATISPYGIKGMLYIFSSSFIKTAHLYGSSIGSPSLYNSPELISRLCIIAFLLTMCAVKYMKKGRIEISILFAECFMLFIKSAINFQYLLIPSVITIAEYINQLFPLSFLKIAKHKIACITAVIAFTALSSAIAIPLNESTHVAYPKNALGYLKRYEKKSVRVMTTSHTGAYMENAGYIIFIDERLDIWNENLNKKDNILEDYIISNISYQNFLEIRRKYNFQYVMADRNTRFKSMCDMDKTLRIAAEDKDSVMYKVIGPIY